MRTVQSIFEEFEKSRASIEISLSQMKKDLCQFTGGVVLYGAGSAGIAFWYVLREHGIETKYFADGNQAKWGSLVEGVEVIAPSEIVPRAGADALVIVTINTDGKRYCKSFAEALRINGHGGVHQHLRKCGCKNLIDYTFFRRCHELFRHEKYNLPSCSDVYLMRQHQTEIKRVYEFLEDDMSRDTFLKILEFRLLDDSINVPTMSQEKQYFEYGFYEKQPDEVFVDCGAFDGISLRTFLQENENHFETYIGIEPDKANYLKLVAYTEKLPGSIKDKIHLVQAAAYSHEKGCRLYSLEGPGSFVADIGATAVRTVMIDRILEGKKATYIKMNIEGTELEALKGAEKTISKYKPKLAIAGYHATKDFWEVPLLMKEYNNSYKVYLRSYMNHISFVYYGV